MYPSHFRGWAKGGHNCDDEQTNTIPLGDDPPSQGLLRVQGEVAIAVIQKMTAREKSSSSSKGEEGRKEIRKEARVIPPVLICAPMAYRCRRCRHQARIRTPVRLRWDLRGRRQSAAERTSNGHRARTECWKSGNVYIEPETVLRPTTFNLLYVYYCRWMPCHVLCSAL